MKKSTMGRAFLASLCLHLWFFIPGGCGTGGSKNEGSGSGSGSNSPVNITIYDKPKTGAKGATESCPDAFGGIGITFNGIVIMQIHHGYPAERAGLQSGDFILGDPYAVKGPIGSPVTVTVMRGTKQLTFQMKRERICADKMK